MHFLAISIGRSRVVALGLLLVWPAVSSALTPATQKPARSTGRLKKGRPKPEWTRFPHPGSGEVPELEVGLMTRQSTVRITSQVALQIEVEGEVFVTSPGEVWTARLPGKSAGSIELVDPSKDVRATGQHLSWTRREPIEGSPPARPWIQVLAVEHDVGLEAQGRQDREYAGSIHVVRDKAGLLAVVNRLDLERYLEGVLPCEMSASAPYPALLAQAIAARSLTRTLVARGAKGEPFDLGADQYYQAYAGRTRWKRRTAQAVRGTAGIVLRKDRSFVPAYYSACCGGHGENRDMVWGGRRHSILWGRPDSPAGHSSFPRILDEVSLSTWLEAPGDKDHCAPPAGESRRSYRWTERFDAGQLEALIGAKHAVGAVMALEPVARGTSGRVLELRVVGAEKSVVIEGELTIRKLLGGLRSSLFVIEVTRDVAGRPIAWTLRGAGFGHGVGLCQEGAMGMAAKGATHSAILTHYFPGCRPVRLY